MNPTSAILRIIAGLGVIAVAAYVYTSNKARIAGTDTAMVQVFGFQTEATSGQILFVFAAFGLVGLVLILLGIAGLLRRG